MAMQVHHDLASLGSLRGPVYLAIGIFDGVHRGHQALIEEARADAEKTGGTAVVMTFEPHPMMFFQRSEPPLRLSSPRLKELLLQRQGVEHLVVLPFEAARAGQTAEDFVEDLRVACRPLGGIVVGADWKFGKGRTGDVALLQKLGGFEVDGIPAVALDGEVISSTAIRLAVVRQSPSTVKSFPARRSAWRSRGVTWLLSKRLSDVPIPFSDPWCPDAERARGSGFPRRTSTPTDSNSHPMASTRPRCASAKSRFAAFSTSACVQQCPMTPNASWRFISSISTAISTGLISKWNSCALSGRRKNSDRSMNSAHKSRGILPR
jgi:cytidyltransferase-like protein